MKRCSMPNSYKSLRYFAISIPKWLPRVPFWLLERFCFASRAKHAHDGIKIIDYTPGSKNIETFVSRTGAALDLISKEDFRRR